MTTFQAEFGARRVRFAARRTGPEQCRTALQAEFAALRNIGFAARTSHGSGLHRRVLYVATSQYGTGATPPNVTPAQYHLSFGKSRSKLAPCLF